MPVLQLQQQHPASSTAAAHMDKAAANDIDRSDSCHTCSIAYSGSWHGVLCCRNAWLLLTQLPLQCS
jgi:hypothetical protein